MTVALVLTACVVACVVSFVLGLKAGGYVVSRAIGRELAEWLLAHGYGRLEAGAIVYQIALRMNKRRE